MEHQVIEKENIRV